MLKGWAMKKLEECLILNGTLTLTLNPSNQGSVQNAFG